MAKLMRCKTPHWQGHKFIPRGALRPNGHPDVNVFFEPYMDEEPAPKPTRAKKTT